MPLSGRLFLISGMHFFLQICGVYLSLTHATPVCAVSLYEYMMHDFATSTQVSLPSC